LVNLQETLVYVLIDSFFSQSFPHTIGGGNLSTFVFAEFFRVFLNFYLLDVSIISPFWFVSWGWLIHKNIKAKASHADRFMLVLFCFLLLMLVLQVWTGQRRAQALVFHLFSFLMLSIFVYDFSCLLTCNQKEMARKRKRTFVFFTITLIFVTIEITCGKFPFNNFSRKLLITSIGFQNIEAINIKDDPLYLDAKKKAEFIKKKCKQGDNILFDNKNLMVAVSFFTKDSYGLYLLPVLKYPPNRKYRHQKERKSDWPLTHKHPVLININKSFQPRTADIIELLTFEDASELVQSKNISYLISSGKKSYGKVFDEIPLFEPCHVNGMDTHSVYSVNLKKSNTLKVIPTKINRYTKRILRKFYKKDEDGFKVMWHSFFLEHLGWTIENSIQIIYEFQCQKNKAIDAQQKSRGKLNT
jgi:hypothetical protein